jgi:hypothetical protein
MSTLHNGYTKRISNEEQRANELAATIDFLVADPDNTYWQTRLAVIRDDMDTETLAQLVDLCNTDPEHILNTAQEVDDWMQRDDAAGQYGNAWLAEQDAMARDYEDWMQQTEDLRHGG